MTAHAIGWLLAWLSGVASLGALLLVREHWFRRGRRPLPPATKRQIRRAPRLPLPTLYDDHPRDSEDTL